MQNTREREGAIKLTQHHLIFTAEKAKNAPKRSRAVYKTRLVLRSKYFTV